MLPRECDNDNCDYEPHTDETGRVRGRWEHVPSCRTRLPLTKNEWDPPSEYYLV